MSFIYVHILIPPHRLERNPNCPKKLESVSPKNKTKFTAPSSSASTGSDTTLVQDDPVFQFTLPTTRSGNTYNIQVIFPSLVPAFALLVVLAVLMVIWSALQYPSCPSRSSCQASGTTFNCNVYGGRNDSEVPQAGVQEADDPQMKGFPWSNFWPIAHWGRRTILEKLRNRRR